MVFPSGGGGMGVGTIGGGGGGVSWVTFDEGSDSREHPALDIAAVRFRRFLTETRLAVRARDALAADVTIEVGADPSAWEMPAPRQPLGRPVRVQPDASLDDAERAQRQIRDAVRSVVMQARHRREVADHAARAAELHGRLTEAERAAAREQEARRAADERAARATEAAAEARAYAQSLQAMDEPAYDPPPEPPPAPPRPPPAPGGGAAAALAYVGLVVLFGIGIYLVLSQPPEPRRRRKKRKKRGKLRRR